jgi:hypothetical protein
MTCEELTIFRLGRSADQFAVLAPTSVAQDHPFIHLPSPNYSCAPYSEVKSVIILVMHIKSGIAGEAPSEIFRFLSQNTSSAMCLRHPERTSFSVAPRDHGNVRGCTAKIHRSTCDLHGDSGVI